MGSVPEHGTLNSPGGRFAEGCYADITPMGCLHFAYVGISYHELQSPSCGLVSRITCGLLAIQGPSCSKESCAHARTESARR